MALASYAFRVDASNQIGHGHLMRCLTIANELKKLSIQSFFICRMLDSKMKTKVMNMGHNVFNIPISPDDQFDWEVDSDHTKLILNKLDITWLVIDHYSINILWETKLRENCKNLMVIDDLANRPHDCDILLDQNLGRTDSSYLNLIPKSSKILAGLGYTLIRDEFLTMRDESLKLRKAPELKNILISMGGSDPHNFSTRVLKDLRECSLPIDCKISIILGERAPFINEVQNQLESMPFETKLHLGVSNMAKLLLGQDLIIGAVGTSAWERCCLGLPSISLVIAENQEPGAKALHLSGATIVIDQKYSDGYSLRSAINYFKDPKNLIEASSIAASLVDGLGVQRVTNSIQ